jgi:hypothetical protein
VVSSQRRRFLLPGRCHGARHGLQRRRSLVSSACGCGTAVPLVSCACRAPSTVDVSPPLQLDRVQGFDQAVRSHPVLALVGLAIVAVAASPVVSLHRSKPRLRRARQYRRSIFELRAICIELRSLYRARPWRPPTRQHPLRRRKIPRVWIKQQIPYGTHHVLNVMAESEIVAVLVAFKTD